MANESNSTATVFVGCKLPHGLILELSRLVPASEAMQGGGTREIKIAQRLSEKRYTLNGTSHPQNMAPRAMIVDGAAVTAGIPKDFWDEWQRQHRDAAYVRNHLVFAFEKMDAVAGYAKDHNGERSGFERLDPAKLPQKISTSDLIKAPA